jgi:hypothetical protein
MEFNNETEIIEVKKLTMVERLKYFFTNPNKIFEDYNVKPAWVLKTLIIVALTVVATIITTKLIADLSIDRMLTQSPDMTREQAEAVMNSPIVIGLAIGGAIFAATAAVFLASLIYWGLIALFGGKTTYTRVVSVYTLAYLPYLIGSFISLAFAYYMNNFDSMLQPQIKDVLFNRFDLFVIWQVLLLVFGFAKISGLKLHKTAIIVAIMWIMATCVQLIPLFMGKMI